MKPRRRVRFAYPLVNPRPATASVRRSMQGNKARDTRPERALRSELWKLGIRGYRLSWRGAPGRPDICFPAARLAVFVHGCFWHRCPTCRPPLPKTHKAFWREKFRRNRTRDRRKVRELVASGWRVIELWECQLRKDIQRAASIVRGAFPRRRAFNVRGLAKANQAVGVGKVAAS